MDYVEGNYGESLGASRKHSLTITQHGSDLVFSGFFGEPTSCMSTPHQDERSGNLELDRWWGFMLQQHGGDHGD